MQPLRVSHEQDKHRYRKGQQECAGNVGWGGTRKAGGLAGLPFVGQAGKLLDLLLSALMFNSDDYYIANIVMPPSRQQGAHR